MHPLTFEVKRTHWRTTWTAIELYRDAAVAWEEATLADMTPAGCDILQAVWDHGSDERARREAEGDFSGSRQMPLAKLRAKLGLAGTTVWRCAQRLAKLSWIMLCPDREKKRRVVVALTELGIHALRMAQKCALTDFVDQTPELRECMYRRLDFFVALDAERQDLVASTTTPASGETPDSAPVDAPPPPPPPPPATDAAVCPTPRTRRSFGCWRDYFWWLVEHVRGLAQDFGSTAGRLYFRTARHQVVHEQDDTWFFFDEETDEEPCDDDDDGYDDDDAYDDDD